MIRILVVSGTMVVINLLGDYYVKIASLGNAPKEWQKILLGASLYGVSALGWVFIYRHGKFFTVEAISAIGSMVISLLVSQIVFKEKISSNELIGVVLGLASVYMLLKGEYKT